MNMFTTGLMGIVGITASAITGFSHIDPVHLADTPNLGSTNIQAPVRPNIGAALSAFEQAKASGNAMQITADQAQGLVPNFFENAPQKVKDNLANDTFYTYTTPSGHKALVIVNQNGKPIALLLIGSTPNSGELPKLHISAGSLPTLN